MRAAFIIAAALVLLCAVEWGLIQWALHERGKEVAAQVTQQARAAVLECVASGEPATTEDWRALLEECTK